MMKHTKIKRPNDWTYQDNFKDVYLNEYGYYEIRGINTPEERKKFFEDHYFQDYSGATYEKTEYPEDELNCIKNKIIQRAYVIEQNLEKVGNPKKEQYSLLDIGCGEGFLMQYFYEKGVTVKGLDIGAYALEQFHPHLLPYLEQGEMEKKIPEMAAREEKFDVINMDRTLNMVFDAVECVRVIQEIMTEQSILVIKVANDYSYLQQSLLESGELKKEYWYDAPNQTRYFNKEGLINLLEANGFVCIDFYGDTFVDFQLLNPFTNYYEKPETGKAAHKTAVRMENLFHEISMERTVEIYRMLGDMGFGREVVGVFRKV